MINADIHARGISAAILLRSAEDIFGVAVAVAVIVPALHAMSESDGKARVHRLGGDVLLSSPPGCTTDVKAEEIEMVDTPLGLWLRSRRILRSLNRQVSPNLRLRMVWIGWRAKVSLLLTYVAKLTMLLTYMCP